MFKKVLVFLVYLYYFVIATVIGWRPYRIEFTNVSSNSYDNFIEVNTSISTNGALSIYVNVLQDISSVHVKALIMIASSSESYDLQLLNRSLNICEFLRNRKYEPILQVFYSALTKTATFPKSCPIRKKLYFFKDVLIDPEDLPPVMPSRKGYADLTVMSKNGSKLRPLLGLTLHVESNQLK